VLEAAGRRPSAPHIAAAWTRRPRPQPISPSRRGLPGGRRQQQAEPEREAVRAAGRDDAWLFRVDGRAHGGAGCQGDREVGHPSGCALPERRVYRRGEGGVFGGRARARSEDSQRGKPWVAGIRILMRDCVRGDESEPGYWWTSPARRDSPRLAVGGRKRGPIRSLRGPLGRGHPGSGGAGLAGQEAEVRGGVAGGRQRGGARTGGSGGRGCRAPARPPARTGPLQRRGARHAGGAATPPRPAPPQARPATPPDAVAPAGTRC